MGSAALIGIGAGRIMMGHRKGWVAFTIDDNGIYFAKTQPEGEASFFAWDQVSAIVLFSRRTEFLRGAVSCIGVRLHPVATDSPEQHLARLAQESSRPDLELHVWEQLRELNAGPSGSELEYAVSCHTEARSWGCRSSPLKHAIRIHAPGVPVIRFSAHHYYDLVGWRADQDRLRNLLDDAGTGSSHGA